MTDQDFHYESLTASSDEPLVLFENVALRMSQVQAIRFGDNSEKGEPAHVLLVGQTYALEVSAADATAIRTYLIDQEATEDAE